MLNLNFLIKQQFKQLIFQLIYYEASPILYRYSMWNMCMRTVPNTACGVDFFYQFLQKLNEHEIKTSQR